MSTPRLPSRSSSSNADDPIQRRRAALHRAWTHAKQDYEAARCPFGDDQRGLEVWIEFGRGTTAN